MRVSVGGEGGDKGILGKHFIPYREQIYKKSMTLHPFGDNFTEQRAKYTLSGAMCYKRCVEIEGKMRYNVGNMFDDVGKMRNDAEKLSNNVGKDGTTTWKNCWKNAQHFWRNTACAEGGIKKCPRKGGIGFMVSLKRLRRCSEFTN